MMKLILIRHGDAGAYTLPDHERNLSPLGQAQAKQTADWLTRSPYLKTPMQFISSPYNRANQTLNIITDTLSIKLGTIDSQTIDGITPNDRADLAIIELGKKVQNPIITDNGTLVVVCHMNIIANLASLLTGNDEIGFDLAEARVYEMDFLAEQTAKQIDGFCPKK